MCSIFLLYHQEMGIPKLDFKKNKNSSIIIISIIIAIIFYQLSHSEQSSLLAIILLLIIYGIYISASTSSSTQPASSDPKKLNIEKTIEDRIEHNDRISSPSSCYYIKSFPKTGLKYLRENDEMLSVAQNLTYLRVYDRSRFQDMLLLMDRLQKIYMYILVGRYDCRQGLNLFMDVRELIREKLYSFFIITPMKMKHAYGLDPHGELDKSIQNFTATSRKMISVLENFARRECKVPYVDPTVPLAADLTSSMNVLP